MLSGNDAETPIWDVDIPARYYCLIFCPLISPCFLLLIHSLSSIIMYANVVAKSDESKICVVMVGLPARGKSLIAGKGMSLRESRVGEE
jgi:hypothetical protein